MGEGDHEKKRPRVGGAAVVLEEAQRVEADLVVEVELVGGLGDAGLLDAQHVVVPPVDALQSGWSQSGVQPNRPGRCRASAAPRSRAAGRGRRSASCRRGRSSSPRRAGRARSSATLAAKARRRCRRRRSATAAGRSSSTRATARRAGCCSRRARTARPRPASRSSAAPGPRGAVAGQGRRGELVRHDDQDVGLARVLFHR